MAVAELAEEVIRPLFVPPVEIIVRQVLDDILEQRDGFGKLRQIADIPADVGMSVDKCLQRIRPRIAFHRPLSAVVIAAFFCDDEQVRGSVGSNG